MHLIADELVVDVLDLVHVGVCSAAAASPAWTLSSTCDGRFAPGMAQETASNIRIQRSASCAIVASGGTSFSQPLDRIQPGIVIDAGEGLALIEGFTVPVEVAVIVGGEGGARASSCR